MDGGSTVGAAPAVAVTVVVGRVSDVDAVGSAAVMVLRSDAEESAVCWVDAIAAFELAADEDAVDEQDAICDASTGC